MSNIKLRYGTEGDRHDPYAFTEVVVERDGKKPIVFHEGLGVELHIGKERTAADYMLAAAYFQILTGMTPIQAMRAYRKAQEARRRPHKRHGTPEWTDGYPGEAFLFCPCGAVLETSFDESAII